MDRKIASLLIVFTTDFFIESVPIKSGFSVKFKPLFNKEETHPKTFGALFAKISQEYTPEAILRRELFAKSLPPPSPELGHGCSNQVARMMKYPDNTSSDASLDGQNSYINLPIIQQPYKDYKILVVTAPPDVKLGRTKDEKRVVIYVVYPSDATSATTAVDETGSDAVTIPDVYFVNKLPEHNVNAEKGKVKSDPVIIVDSNRTVTGLKSKYVEKLIKFKNSLLKRYNYVLTP